MSDYQRHPWLVHLVYKLLLGHKRTLSLLANNPFPNAPPRFIWAELYRYEFTNLTDATKAWWKRQRVGTYLPPLSTDHPGLQDFLQAYGWLSKEKLPEEP